MHAFYLVNITKGDKRSIKAKKNIIASAIIKGADTLVYLLLVPLTLGYLNAYEYGIWLTLNSILSWINSFDIGLGSGLRNKLAIAEADKDKEKARSYVSTTFVMLLFITTVIFILFSIFNGLIDWYSALNVDTNAVHNIRGIIGASFLFFCLNFIFKFIGNVYQAKQLPAVNYFITFMGHFLSLVLIFILKETISGSLFWVAVVYSASPPIVYMCCYPVTFMKLFPYLSPSFRYFKKELLRDLMSLSILFFILQIMGIVLFSLSNVLISHLFGPDQVTPYNLTYRYFSVISMVFSLFLAPIWSATTDAYAKGEIAWIKNCVSKLSKVMILISFLIMFMIFASPIAYKIWIGDAVEIPFVLSMFMGVYMFVLLWSLCFSSVLNGMGILYIQTINILGMSIFFYPLCWGLGNYYGVEGVVIAMIILTVPGATLNTVQLYKLTHGTASGIWLR